MARIRLRPRAGTQRVASIAASALSRRPVGAVHRDEPLRGGAEDQRRLGAPAVRVAVHQRAAGQEIALRQQRLDHRLGGLEHVQAGEARRRLGVGAVLGHRVGHLEPVPGTQLEIVLAVAGRDVDEARALLGGDEIAGQQRDAGSRSRRHGRASGWRAMLPASAVPSNSSSVAWVRMPAASATSARRSTATTKRSPGRTRAPSATSPTSISR